MPMGMNELGNQCLKKENSELRRTVYLCTDDNLRGADMDIVHPQERMMESDYIVMPCKYPAINERRKQNEYRHGNPAPRKVIALQSES